DLSRLLLSEDPKICFTCHGDKEQALKKKTVHAPVASGCINCHNPHGGKFPRFFVAAFPTSLYVEFSKEKFALCFGCHDDGLVMKEKTTDATNFRNKDRNLHSLHVKKDKGRVCFICHDIHASNNPSIIRDSVPFGKWALPLNYMKKEKGGVCAPGCHKKVEYER
ncbi:MAG: cytochrome c3 family protein, partial [Candidatus Aenigmatarchaeota archaeon]